MDSPHKDYKQLYNETLEELNSLKLQMDVRTDASNSFKDTGLLCGFVQGCQLPFLLMEGEFIKESNSGAVDFLGKKFKSDLIDHSILDFSPEIQSDDVPSREKWNVFSRGIQKPGNYKFLWDFILDDDVIPCRLYITTILRNNVPYFVITGLNISEELRYEDEIKQLSLVANYTGSGVVLTDEESRIVWVNNSFTTLTGYSLSEVKGRVPGHFLQGPLTDEGTVNEMRAHLSAKEPFQVELVNYKKNGETYWVEIKVNPTFSSKGKLVRYIGLSTDITERKKAEIALSKSEELHRSILTIAQEAIVLVDQEGVSTYANPHYSKLMGVPLDKVVGIPFADSLHPKTRGFWLQKFEERKKGKVGNYDKLLTTCDQREIWVHITGTAVRDDRGEFCGSLIMMYDIDDRKRNEERLIQRDVFLTALTDSQQILMDVKMPIKDSIHVVLEKLSKALGADLMRLIRWENGQVFLLGEHSNASSSRSVDEDYNDLFINYGSDFYQKLTKGDFLELDTLELLEHSDFVGSIMHSASYIIVPMHRDVQVLGFLLVGRKKQAKEWSKAEKEVLRSTSISFSMALEYRGVLDSLNESRDQLEDSNKRLAQEVQRADDANAAKGRFLANMSHEIRTPLNGILGYAQLMERSEGLSEEDLRRIKTIRSSGVHLLTLINDILDLSKVEAGKMPIEKDWFGIRHFMDEIVSMLKIKADEKYLQLDWKTEGFHALPLQVFSDMRLLRQILINLIGNAIKYTEKGSVQLRVKVLEKDEEKILLRFEIIDSGIGIEEEHVKQLFTEFFQVGAAQQMNETGTGLGLSLSARMVKLLGGRIQVTSKLGQGSCFSFALIMSYKSDDIDSNGVVRYVKGYEGERKNILIIDDIEDNRVVLKDFLQEIGFNVWEATDGNEALVLCQKITPDMIFCDLVMPYISGFDFAKLIKKKELLKNLPIVAVSASVSNDYYTLESLDAFDDFLPKPVERHALYEVLREMLNLKWIYGDQEGSGACLSHQIDHDLVEVQVDHQILEHMRSAAEMGDMSTVIHLAEDLKESGDEYQPLAEALKRYAGSFDEDAIVSLVDKMEGDDD